MHMALKMLEETIKIKASILEKDEESSPCLYGRVGDSPCINTPGCQTVKFLWVLRTKCQRNPATGGAFGHLGAVEIFSILKKSEKGK